MDISLNGKRALVCGASQGIGRAAAQELARNGASVTLLARNPETLQDALASLSVHGGQSHHAIA
ncbi:MAG: SDR family NAD(P)-dependent oxidoreductase, partial [Candidatus Kapabacteria bacterium]|nr:SDR family NAD(P)-dependent oxidoreductase [Candidatus Kapabacteria bacterium]